VSALFDVVSGGVRLWVRLYTLNLPQDVKERRRLEIESDVWEQVADVGGLRPALAFAIGLRCLCGAPADVAWRLSAPGQHRTQAVLRLSSEGRTAMDEQRDRFLALSALCGLLWAAVCVLLLAPAPHSLAYAGGLLTLVALAGWALELRTESDDAATSGWPLLLATGVAACGLGLVVSAPWAGMLVALPLAGAASFKWLAYVREEVDVRRALALSAPVAASELPRRAAAGDAIVLERAGRASLPRREILRAGLWLALGSYAAAFAGSALDYLWERKPTLFGGIVSAGNAAVYPPGSKTRIQEGRFWLVHLTAEQGGPGFLALWQKCPHLGCTVPWDAGFRFKDAETGEARKGWFRCPCHQSTYNDAGVRVFGPAPRSMDRMALTIDPATNAITVDTGRIEKGSTNNASHAVRPANEA
jgi:cytochrome b6-f complex iron-sulfur subunit